MSVQAASTGRVELRTVEWAGTVFRMLSKRGAAALDSREKAVLTLEAGLDKLGAAKPSRTPLPEIPKRARPSPKVDKQAKEAINKAIAMSFLIYVILRFSSKTEPRTI